MNKLSIVNVNWSEDVLTVTLEERRPDLTADPMKNAQIRQGWTRAEAMLLVDRLEKFLSSDPDILEANVVMIEGKPTNIPLVTPRELLLAVRDPADRELVEESIAPRQQELNKIIGSGKAPEEIVKDIQDVSALNLRAAHSTQLDIEDAIKERQQKQTETPAPVPVEDNYKVDMGGHPSTLLPPEPVSDEDREGELEVAFGVFEDSLREVRDMPSAVRIWLEAQQLLAKHPSLRDRARLVMAGHLGKVLGVDSATASEKMREALQARQRLMQGANTPDVQPEPAAVETPAPQQTAATPTELNAQQKDFLVKLGSEQKQVMGTVVKVACQVVANPAKEVSPGLVESFLLSMVGHHPLLSHDGAADEVRALMQSTRFKLFALAAKTKIIEA